MGRICFHKLGEFHIAQCEIACNYKCKVKPKGGRLYWNKGPQGRVEGMPNSCKAEPRLSTA